MPVNPIVNLLPIVLVFFVMYFLLIRPQSKQQQALVKMQASLKKNDEVVTVGGVHGVIVNVKEDVVTLRVDDNTRIDVDKVSITRRVKEGS